MGAPPLSHPVLPPIPAGPSSLPLGLALFVPCFHPSVPMVLMLVLFFLSPLLVLREEQVFALMSLLKLPSWSRVAASSPCDLVTLPALVAFKEPQSILLWSLASILRDPSPRQLFFPPGLLRTGCHSSLTVWLWWKLLDSFRAAFLTSYLGAWLIGWIKLHGWPILCWNAEDVKATISGFGALWHVDRLSDKCLNVAFFRANICCQNVGLIPEVLNLMVDDRLFSIPVEIESWRMPILFCLAKILIGAWVWIQGRLKKAFLHKRASLRFHMLGASRRGPEF
uniref:Uncharacterized protein n=1 Tax=Ananas comosus var. bracteatus TaxID=296719 RepID=A0A6V7PGA6_ANACO|nr:unnamed protein product [Ananas comosus var. bracteatus]